MMEQAGEDTNFFSGLVQENLLLYLKSVTTEFIWIGCLCECEKISLFNWSVGAQPFFVVMSYASLVCSDCTLDLSWNAGPPLWSRWWSDALWATTLTRWWLHLLSCYVQKCCCGDRFYSNKQGENQHSRFQLVFQGRYFFCCWQFLCFLASDIAKILQ